MVHEILLPIYCLEPSYSILKQPSGLFSPCCEQHVPHLPYHSSVGISRVRRRKVETAEDRKRPSWDSQEPRRGILGS